MLLLQNVQWQKLLQNFSLAAKSYEARATIRPSFHLSERTSKQRLTTERADKVFDVVTAWHCWHTSAEDWTTTSGTLWWSSVAHDVPFTVRVAITTLIATTGLQTNTAVLHNDKYYCKTAKYETLCSQPIWASYFHKNDKQGELSSQRSSMQLYATLHSVHIGNQ